MINVNVKSTRNHKKGYIHHMINVDVKSTRNNENWIRPFDKCEMWMSSLPEISRMGSHPLISVDVKYTLSIKNGFIVFVMLKMSMCS